MQIAEKTGLIDNDLPIGESDRFPHDFDNFPQDRFPHNPLRLFQPPTAALFPHDPGIKYRMM